jgi:transcription initiation factor IIE alpha subunit
MNLVKYDKPIVAEEKRQSGIFTCPMDSHADVLQYGPGKCSKCGMTLVEIEKAKSRIVFYCPMTEDSVATNQAGRCSKCGMKLVQLKMSESHD